MAESTEIKPSQPSYSWHEFMRQQMKEISTVSPKMVPKERLRSIGAKWQALEPSQRVKGVQKTKSEKDAATKAEFNFQFTPGRFSALDLAERHLCPGVKGKKIVVMRTKQNERRCKKALKVIDERIRQGTLTDPYEALAAGFNIPLEFLAQN